MTSEAITNRAFNDAVGSAVYASCSSRRYYDPLYNHRLSPEQYCKYFSDPGVCKVYQQANIEN